MAYKQIPALQISTGKPLYPISFTISGAIYAGVPHYSNRTSFSSIFLDTPKSPSLIFPWPSSKILSNLISL